MKQLSAVLQLSELTTISRVAALHGQVLLRTAEKAAMAFQVSKPSHNSKTKTNPQIENVTRNSCLHFIYH